MTNVPNELRDMWTDLYKLFDIHYRMENTVEEWGKFLNHAQEVWEKHNRNERLISMINIVIDMIGDRIKADEKTANAERK